MAWLSYFTSPKYFVCTDCGLPSHNFRICKCMEEKTTILKRSLDGWGIEISPFSELIGNKLYTFYIYYNFHPETNEKIFRYVRVLITCNSERLEFENAYGQTWNMEEISQEEYDNRKQDEVGSRMTDSVVGLSILQKGKKSPYWGKLGDEACLSILKEKNASKHWLKDSDLTLAFIQ